MSKIQEETKRKQRSSGLTKKQILWGNVSVVVIALLFLFFYTTISGKERFVENNFVQDTSQESQNVFRHPLTGVWLNEAIDLPYVFGVMIDNHADARLQSGIDQAFLIIEAPVEAGIPRMIAFFDSSENVEKIGPVRSARPYFIDWNNEFDALYAHVGGSNEALDKIVSGDTFDMNEYSHSSSFWRATTRYAPHNAYTSTDRLNKYLQTRIDSENVPEVLYESWQYKDPEVASDHLNLSKVLIDFWAPIYTVEWSFDFEKGTYIRSQAGEIDLTLNGLEVNADNVVVIVTDVSVIDSVGRRKVRTIGEGTAWVMQDGNIIEAVWEKPSVSQRLRFYVGEEEIKMNPGKTWIEVVPSVYDVTFE